MNAWRRIQHSAMPAGTLLAVALAFVAPAAAEQVLVRNYANPALEVGQGYLTHYADVCYVLAPTHVLEESGTPAALLGEGTEPPLGETVDARALGDDVSVASVDGGLTGHCGYSAIAISRSVDRTIQDNGIATVRSVNGDGTIAQIAVSLFDDDGVTFLRVQPTRSDNQLRKGQSGSLIVVGDRPIAMLLSVDARFGVGKAIRIDAMLKRFDGFVRGGESMAGGHVPSGDAAAAAPMPVADGAKGLPLTLTDWSALPTDAEHRPSNLVARSPDAAPWRARVTEWPVMLEFSLGDQRVAIDEVRLEAGGLASTVLPGQVEIQVSSTVGQDRWRSVTSGPADFSSGVAIFPLAPTWARKVRLVIGAGDDTVQVALRRVRILPAD